MDRAAVLRASIRRAEEELARIEATPDPAAMLDGTVVRWDRVYPSGQAARRGMYVPEPEPVVYTFVALKAAGRWYSTARDTDVLSDAEVRDVLADPGVTKIEVATWTPVAEAVDHLAVEPAPDPS